MNPTTISPQILGVLGLDYTPAIKASEYFQKELQQVSKTLDQLKAKFNATTLDFGVKQAVKNLKPVKEQTEALAKRQGELLGQLERRMGWFVSGAMFYGTAQIVREIANAAIEVQAGVYRIKKVMDDASIDWRKFRDDLIDLATRYGVAVKDVLDAAQLWAQAGYRGREVLELTRTSLLGMTVAELNATESVKLLVSALKQFNLSVDKSNQVLDIANQLSNDYAVTARDVLDAIAVTGSVARNAGVDIFHLAGYVTALAEGSARSGKEIGNALKSIYSFMQRPKAIEVFKKMGVDVMDAAGNFRNFDTVLKELAEKWTGMTMAQRMQLHELSEQYGLVAESVSDLTDAEKTEIAQAGANLFRRNYFITLLERYHDAIRATETATNSLGSAEREAAILMNSTQKHVEQLKSSMTALAVAIGDAGLLRVIRSGADEIRFWVNEFRDLPPAAQSAVIVFGELAVALGVINVTSRTFLGIGLTGAVKSLAAAMVGAEAATLSLGRALTIIARNPIVLAIGGLTALITGIRLYTKHQEELIDRTLEMINQHRIEAEQAKAKAQQLTELVTVYETLSQKTSLTSEEQNKLNQAISRIAEVLPAAIEGYDAAGNVVLNLANVTRIAADETARLTAEMQIQAQAAAEIARARLPFLREEKLKAEQELKDYTRALRSPWPEGELLRLEPKGYMQLWEMLAYDEKKARQRLSELAEEAMKRYSEAAKAVAEAEAALRAGELMKSWTPRKPAAYPSTLPTGAGGTGGTGATGAGGRREAERYIETVRDWLETIKDTIAPYSWQVEMADYSIQKLAASHNLLETRLRGLIPTYEQAQELLKNLGEQAEATKTKEYALAHENVNLTKALKDVNAKMIALDDLHRKGKISAEDHAEGMRLLKDKARELEKQLQSNQIELINLQVAYEKAQYAQRELIEEYIRKGRELEYEQERNRLNREREEALKRLEQQYQREIRHIEEARDAFKQASDERIRRLQEELDLLERRNEEYEEQQRLLEAEQALEEARQRLANIEAERSVRIFRDGRWEWVADPVKLIEAKNAVRDAEKQLEEARREVELAQQRRQLEDQIAFERRQQEIQLDSFQKQLEQAREYWDRRLEDERDYWNTKIEHMENYYKYALDQETIQRDAWLSIQENGINAALAMWENYYQQRAEMARQSWDEYTPPSRPSGGGGGASMPTPTPGPGWRPVSEKSPVGISWGGIEYVSYQHGTEYVPRTGLALLHEGERVIPANLNRLIPRISTSQLTAALQTVGRLAQNTIYDYRKYDNSTKFLGNISFPNVTDVEGVIREFQRLAGKGG